MSRIPLPGGAYSARSSIAACTRSINYYPEPNPEGPAIIPTTQYQSPGLRPLVSPPEDNRQPCRQIFQVSNGDGYCVIGQKVYYIKPDWTLTEIGTLTQPGTNPAYFIDNGHEALLVDSSIQCYQIVLTSRAFTPIADGLYVGGGVRCDTIDGFVLWNRPNTREFKSSLAFQLQPTDGTYTAAKVGYPDPLQGLIINRRQILLLGRDKSEIWFNSGGAQFPFAEVPGTYIEHGTASAYSIAASDISVFWLSQDLRGVGYVMRQRGYETKVVSNYALSNVIRKMTVINDAIGFTYTQGGHEFYVLIFPTEDQTWVYDASIEDPNLAWHQRCWTDGQGELHRDRANCGAFLYGKNVVGDWENGTIYEMSLDVYTDTVGGVEYAKTYIRTFPHLPYGQIDPTGIPPQSLGQQIRYEQFVLDMECGEGQGDVAGEDGLPTADKVGLRWSVDRGRTWGQTVLQSTGKPGEFITQPKWGATGAARDMIFEIQHSIKGPAAINGAWVKATLLGN